MSAQSRRVRVAMAHITPQGASNGSKENSEKSAGPMSGYRIIDMTQMVSGPSEYKVLQSVFILINVNVIF